MAVILFGFWGVVTVGLLVGLIRARLSADGARQRKHSIGLLIAAAATPFLGLIGTVVGLTLTFKSLGNVPADQKQALLSRGISESMQSTVWGLSLGLVPLAIGILGLLTAPRAAARPPPAGPPSNPGS